MCFQVDILIKQVLGWQVDLNSIYKPRLSSSLAVNLFQHIITYSMQTTSFIILFRIAGTAFAISLCNILGCLSVV